LRSPITLLTSIFSHRDIQHFLFNMISLYSVGTSVQSIVGTRKLWAIYIAGGVISSFGSEVLQVCLGEQWHSYSLGASGAIKALFGFACKYSQEDWIRTLILLGPDVIGFFQSLTGESRLKIDFVGHLFGFIFGWIYANGT